MVEHSPKILTSEKKKKRKKERKINVVFTSMSV